MTGAISPAPVPQRGRRRIIAFTIAGVVILVLGSLVAFFYIGRTSSSSPTTISSLLTEGSSSYDAHGGSTLYEFNLPSPRGVLVGAFTTNASVAFYVISSLDYQSNLRQSPGSVTPSQWYYASGDVKNANVSVSLYQGTWYLLFSFVNDTGRTVRTANGTGILSETHLTITRTFTVTQEGAQATNSISVEGPTYLDLHGSPGSYAKGTLAVTMSAPGYLQFEIDSETYGAGTGNGTQRARPSNAVVPSGIAFDNGQWGPYRVFITFAVTPDWNGSQGGQGPNTGVQSFNKGAFPTQVVFAPKFDIPPGTPQGQYQLILTVLCYPLDLEGTPGYGGPPSLATFSINLTVN